MLPASLPSALGAVPTCLPSTSQAQWPVKWSSVLIMSCCYPFHDFDTSTSTGTSTPACLQPASSLPPACLQFGQKGANPYMNALQPASSLPPACLRPASSLASSLPSASPQPAGVHPSTSFRQLEYTLRRRFSQESCQPRVTPSQESCQPGVMLGLNSGRSKGPRIQLLAGR